MGTYVILFIIRFPMLMIDTHTFQHPNIKRQVKQQYIVVDRWFTFKKRSLHYRSVGVEVEDDGDVCNTI